MEAGLLEQLLRELPGVLDCSVTDDGVALVVHPEVDPRLIELRAKALLADVDDTKPLLVVGGMPTGSPGLPPPPAVRHRGRSGRSPLSATGVVLLVLALLFVVPIAGRETSSDRDVALPPPALATIPPATFRPALPAPPPSLPAPIVETGHRASAGVEPVAAAVTEVPASTPVSTAPPTAVVAESLVDAPPPVLFAVAAAVGDREKGKAKGKAKAQGSVERAQAGDARADDASRRKPGKPGKPGRGTHPRKR